VYALAAVYGRGGFAGDGMEHPTAIRPEDLAQFNPEKMGKATIFQSDRLMVGLNAFEPGQEHALHSHSGMDKVYQVLQGTGLFLLEGHEIAMEPGILLVAPEGIPHGIRNTGGKRLVVLAILAPAPGA
jgi:quercetin dioxygenase-like cupin family protein